MAVSQKHSSLGRYIFVALALTVVLLKSSFAAPPRVFLLDGAQLEGSRQKIQDGDGRLAPALDELKRQADVALRAGPFSVVNKDATPPSGDKHDYMSLAPYWWPNPDTPDGFPYIRRDGERNPDIYKVRNRLDLGEFVDATETLALAYYFTGNERYADRAATLLRTWFLDPATRMNPHLNYGQAIPGQNSGRAAGLIETRSFARIVDAVGLLAESPAWSDKDQRELQQWFAQFLAWMLDSEIGRDEADGDNNHATYYDVQVASYALFLDRKELAAQVLQAAAEKRIADQVEPDGRQPRELERTKAWSYSVGNLAGLMSLARLGEHVGVDLWNYHSTDGRSIRAALDYLAPFGLGDKKWRYQQINGFSADLFYPLLRVAAVKYPEGSYRSQLSKLPPMDAASRANLLVSPLEPIYYLHRR